MADLSLTVVDEVLQVQVIPVVDDCVVDELGHFSPRLEKQHRQHNCRRTYGEAYASQTTERRQPYLIGEDEAQNASSQLEHEDQGEEHTELDGGQKEREQGHTDERRELVGNTKAVLLHALLRSARSSLLERFRGWMFLEAGWFRGWVV